MTDFTIVVTLPNNNQCNGCLFFRHKNNKVRDILSCLLNTAIAFPDGKKDKNTQRPAECPLREVPK